MKPGKEPDEWGGSAWEEKTPEESKREDGLEDLVKKVGGQQCRRFNVLQRCAHPEKQSAKVGGHKIVRGCHTSELELRPLAIRASGVQLFKVHESLELFGPNVLNQSSLTFGPGR